MLVLGKKIFYLHIYPPLISTQALGIPRDCVSLTTAQLEKNLQHYKTTQESRSGHAILTMHI